MKQSWGSFLGFGDEIYGQERALVFGKVLVVFMTIFFMLCPGEAEPLWRSSPHYMSEQS